MRFANPEMLICLLLIPLGYWLFLKFTKPSTIKFSNLEALKKLEDRVRKKIILIIKWLEGSRFNTNSHCFSKTPRHIKTTRNS